MKYIAFEVNRETACWMVQREGETDDEREQIGTRTEAEIWGASTDVQAIEMAKKRESWA